MMIKETIYKRGAQRSQAIVEYLLMLTAVVAILILTLFGKGVFFQGRVENSLNSVAEGAKSIALKGL